MSEPSSWCIEEQTNFIKKYNARQFEFLLEPGSEYRCDSCLQVAHKLSIEKTCLSVFCADGISEDGEDKTCFKCKYKPDYVRDKNSLQNIQELKVRCPNHVKGCLWEGQMKSAEEHMYTVCNFHTVPCKFQDLGCDFKDMRKIVKKHEDSDIEKHKKLTMLSVLKLTEKRDTLEIGQHKIIRIHNFIKQNESRHSNPFYTSSGHKMELQVDPFGAGHRKATHLSVYINILTSRNNIQLNQPYEGTVELELLNQLADRGHYMKVISFEPAEDFRAIGGCGFDDFIPYSKLSQDPDANREYLRNDTLYFRVTLKPKSYKYWLYK